MTDVDVMTRMLRIIKPFARNQEALAQATRETRLLEDLKVNSARLVDIILDMETEFEIEVDDDEADRVRTLGDAVSVIVAKTA